MQKLYEWNTGKRAKKMASQQQISQQNAIDLDEDDEVLI